MEQLVLPFVQGVATPSCATWRVWRDVKPSDLATLSAREKGLLFQAEVGMWHQATDPRMRVAAECPIRHKAGVYKVDLVLFRDMQDLVDRATRRFERRSNLLVLGLWASMFLCFVGAGRVPSLMFGALAFGLLGPLALHLSRKRRLRPLVELASNGFVWVECRNQVAKVTQHYVNEVAKRRDEGTDDKPSRVLIFSASGFTPGALERARAVGIECWVPSPDGFVRVQPASPGGKVVEVAPRELGLEHQLGEAPDQGVHPIGAVVRR